MRSPAAVEEAEEVSRSGGGGRREKGGAIEVDIGVDSTNSVISALPCKVSNDVYQSQF